LVVRDPKFSDCSILKGLPFNVLDLDGTAVTDLSPLRGMLIINLHLAHTIVTDLTPIRDLPLTMVDLTATKVTDLRPLKGMPSLHYLWLGETAVTDLSPLRTLPLKDLRLRNCKNLTDLSPLADIKTLVDLVLPPNPGDTQFLHTLPKLQHVSYEQVQIDPVHEQPSMTTAQFWDSVRAAQEEPWLIALAKAKIVAKTHRLADGSWDVTLDRQPISDLSMLKGAYISRLSIASTPVTDLSPLRGMQLTFLRISGTKVADLSPIQGMPIANITMTKTDVHDLTPLIGMPLRDLYMPDCKQITDLAPLQDITTLLSVVLPPNAKNIEVIRKMPNVSQIGFSLDARKPAEQFWAEYDRKRAAAAATQPGGG
jgi:hypothetical protein